MKETTVYPLHQVLEVKQRRVEEAEKIVKEKTVALEKEEKKLKEVEAERDKVKEHKIAKLLQLRQTLDAGTTTDKVQQMKYYLKTVDEKLVAEEKKVTAQKEKVAAAEKELKDAKEDLRIKRQEVDKLIIHRGDWEKEKRAELRIIEGREQDELGSVIHATNQRRKVS